MEREPSRVEITDWLVAFAVDPARALHEVPHDIYRILRQHYLNAENMLLPAAYSLVSA